MASFEDQLRMLNAAKNAEMSNFERWTPRWLLLVICFFLLGCIFMVLIKFSVGKCKKCSETFNPITTSYSVADLQTGFSNASQEGTKGLEYIKEQERIRVDQINSMNTKDSRGLVENGHNELDF